MRVAMRPMKGGSQRIYQTLSANIPPK